MHGCGQAGDSFQVVPAGFDPRTAGTYQGRVTVTVTEPEGVQGSPQQIDLIVQVIDASFKAVYLPVLTVQ